MEPEYRNLKCKIKISHLPQKRKGVVLKMEEHPEAQNLDSGESLNLDGICRRRNWSKVQRLKRMVKFVVSACVFSFVLGLFFSFFSLFPQPFTLYFSLFSLLNHAFDRNYMFLLCNGILFLLATSSLQQQHHHSNNSHHHHHYHHDLVEQQDQEEDDDDDDDDGDDTSATHSCADLAAMGPTIPIEEEEEEEDDDDEEEGCFTEGGEKRSGDLEVAVSTEELNKKIEEFIRKMKEEMRIEAAEAAQTQPQLVAV